MSKHIKKIKPAAKQPEQGMRVVSSALNCPPVGGGN